MQNGHDDFKKEHPNFVLFFDRLAWGAITAICIYAASQLQKMSESIYELNKNLAVVVSKMEGVNEAFTDIKHRVERLENKARGSDSNR